MNSKYKDYYKKTGKFTEENFKNPTPEMRSDIWWKMAYADWQMANGLLKTYDTAEEALDDIYGKDGYEIQSE